MWIKETFDSINSSDLYNILRLRSEIFVVEQKCIFVDPDNFDIHSSHLYYKESNIIQAYARIIPPGIVYNEASIGRVSVIVSKRKTGLGKELMKIAIAETQKSFQSPIKIMAQSYLNRFYSEFGFVTCSEPFIEDDILHEYMILN